MITKNKFLEVGLLVALAVSGGAGCVADSVVIEEEDNIRAVMRELEKIEGRYQLLRSEIRELQVKAGPEASAKKRLSFEREIARSGLRVSSRGAEIVVTLASTVLFGPGEVKLRNGAQDALKAVSAAIKREFPERMIRVEGHTDSSPPRRVADKYPTNWELSAARALAVVKYLSKEGGLGKSQVFGAAYGHYRPVRENRTSSGREENRRVDIVILPALSMKKVTTAELSR